MIINPRNLKNKKKQKIKIKLKKITKKNELIKYIQHSYEKNISNINVFRPKKTSFTNNPRK